MGNISEPFITLKFTPCNYDYILHVLIVIMEIFCFYASGIWSYNWFVYISKEISKYINKIGNKLDKEKKILEIFSVHVKGQGGFSWLG